MAQTRQPQLNIPGTAGNDGAPVGRKTKEKPASGKRGKTPHGGAVGGANGSGATTL
ncbi:MAG TPA: hypothetical protein VL460_07990 [Caulobacteraceae bacterium]|jgi:hypothetical protein|nr:hypothetical protein [Caulobacteraceae bacterium]